MDIVLLFSLLFSSIILLLLLEQLSYVRKKGPLPGPTFVLPFLGSVIPMIINPTKFWFDLAKASQPTGFSANYLVGKYILFIKSTELSHKIFSNVRSDAFHLIGHPFGKKLFGKHNMIYMFDQEHKDIRRKIAPNFTPRALFTYSRIQQKAMILHFERWLDITPPGKSLKLRLLCRDMNLETSQNVFVGDYLSTEAREQFNLYYNLFNAGLMALPFDFPGFAFRKARLAVDRLVESLSVCVKKSKEQMLAGKEPTCLVDFWIKEALADSTNADAVNETEIGGHLFDFLFAAQDASTSSLLWAVTLLESHPRVLEKVKAEVAAAWSPLDGHPISPEQLRQMKYTEQVAREVVRFRPPATMVPHIASADFPLTDWYTIPKGTIVFPSAYESSFQGFVDPDRFDPDRFGPEREEDRVFRRNFLAFGAGPHQCVGQRYAINHLVLFIALFVSLIEFKRVRMDGCDEIAYVPTIVPKDDCHVYIHRRVERFPLF